MNNTDSVFDVAVVGGGLAGFAAAIASAEAGLRTIIVERRPVLGWEATWAFLLDAGSASSPIAASVLAAVEAAGGRRGDRLDAPILEITLDRLATAAGLRLLYYATPVAIQTANGRVASVVLGWKDGQVAIRARVFVDATENDFLWHKADGSAAPRAAPAARQAFFLNGAGPNTTRAAIGGCPGVHRVMSKPGVWDGEVAVEFECEHTHAGDARRLIPGVLQAVRDQAAYLSAAMLTHSACEPLPLGRPVSARAGERHPRLKNLIAAGAPTADPARLSVSDYIACGEGAGPAIREAAREFPAAAAVTESAAAIAAPPIERADVVVCGGGTAGAMAGIAAAREGAATVILEPLSFLGGIGSGGGIHVYYYGVAGGLQDELDERVRQLTPLLSGAGSAYGYHPEARKIALEQMAHEAGVRVVYGATVTGVELRNIPSVLPATGRERPVRRVEAVVAATPDGSALFQAGVLIDATGDGDVAVKAGAPHTHGREADELTHAFSQSGGVLIENTTLRVVNFDAGYCDPTDLEDLTRARRLGLSHFFRDRYTAENRLLYVAPQLGLRNSRQILGDYVLTLADEIEGRQFPDVVAYAACHYDNHATDYENESDAAAIWVWLLGYWQRTIGCEIPYRCLVPRQVEGLLVACRAISMTHDAHNQLRMQRDMQRLGEAAGVAAAMSVAAGVTPRHVDVTRLQRRLLELGALGPRERPRLPAGAPQEGLVHEPTWEPERLPMKPVQELVASLAGADPRAAIWPLTRAGQEALPLLADALKSDRPQVRLWAAAALAVAGSEAAVPELTACVRARADDGHKAAKQAPLWHAAIVLLGRVGDKAAVPALADVLRDPAAPFDALIAAVRALGRIRDPSAADAVEGMLARTDLPVQRTLQVSLRAAAGSVTEECRWQLELAAAEALARMGRRRADLAEKYLEDDRAYVRRHARKVLRDFDMAG